MPREFWGFMQATIPTRGASAGIPTSARSARPLPRAAAKGARSMPERINSTLASVKILASTPLRISARATQMKRSVMRPALRSSALYRVRRAGGMWSWNGKPWTE